ncbi:MAG: DUF4296 domain-containing protein [Bacteroidota bacterium]
MRIYKYLFFLGLLAFCACIGEAKVPGDVISEDRMPALIADIHIVDGDLYNVAQVPDTLYKYSMGNYQAVFKKHHTDSTQFKKSFTWYTKHPVRLDAIYDDVIKILQTKVDSIAKIKVPPAKPTAPNNKPVEIPVKPANAVPAK